ncbi:hypothetical protein F0562_017540 [Nyssa sinensis]|uniref:Uncharacterized protein n=1 Tax=Nyssa sinensis TaxID=561372 RepID=A0A5J4ZI42_9ASTE|nr:hypothetical protein F0562_017540 [Nyssa sinensis]
MLMNSIGINFKADDMYVEADKTITLVRLFLAQNILYVPIMSARSSSTDRPVPITGVQDRLSVVIQKREGSESTDQWLRSLMIDDEQTSNTTSHKEKMQQIPHTAQNEREHFEPMVVSIGPIHHGKPELQRLEKLKIAFTRQYIRSSSASSDVLYRKVEEVANGARNCYVEDITKPFDDNAFTQMMFLDGCFILQFIYYVVHNRGSEMKMNSIDIVHVKRDLFLVENQLPFQVLEVLMSINFGKGFENINNFIKKIVLPPSADPRLAKLKKFFESILNQERQQGDEEAARNKDKYRHLLDIMWTRLINEKTLNDPTGESTDPYTYRSVQELKAAGITFEPSDTPCFTDVKFTNSAEDVKVLKSDRILFNYAGSDEDVAKSIEDIASRLVPDDRYYRDVKSQIELYFKSRAKKRVATWIAEGPEELLRIVGYSEVNGETASAHHKENLICYDDGAHTAHSLGNRNHVDIKEDIMNTATTGATSSHEKSLNLNLTIVGGLPSTKQNFRAEISLPAIGWNLIAQISFDSDFRDRPCVPSSIELACLNYNISEQDDT